MSVAWGLIDAATIAPIPLAATHAAAMLGTPSPVMATHVMVRLPDATLSKEVLVLLFAFL